MKHLSRGVKAVLMLALLAIFGYSATEVWDYYRESKANKDFVEALIDEVVVMHAPATEEKEVPGTKTAGETLPPEIEKVSSGTNADANSPTQTAAMPLNSPIAMQEDAPSPSPDSETVASTDGTESDSVLPQPQTTDGPEEKILDAEATPDPECLEVAPISINFKKLQMQNKDVVAWIHSPGTMVNHAVLQTDDNGYYMHRMLNGKYNYAGSIFMDYRNHPDFIDWNSVIYGHNMKNGTMFGTLLKYRSQKYYEAHPDMYLLTPEQDYKVKLIAGFTTPADSEVYNIYLQGEEARQVLKEMLEKSDFKADVDIPENPKLLTLSTCTYSYEDARYVVVGLLKKISR